VMYMREPEGSPQSQSQLETSPALSFVLACALAGVVLLGLFPNGLWSLATHAAPLLK
jgi:NADH-quinone oxidoreductase subunit N